MNAVSGNGSSAIASPIKTRSSVIGTTTLISNVVRPLVIVRFVVCAELS